MNTKLFVALYCLIFAIVILLVPVVLNIKGREALPFIGSTIVPLVLSIYNLGLGLIQSEYPKTKEKTGNYRSSIEEKKDSFLKMPIP